MLPLAMIAEGEEVKLINIVGGRGMRRRLADLGLNPGMLIKVVRVDPQGPMIVAVKGSRIALGRGMAQKVMVDLNTENTFIGSRRHGRAHHNRVGWKSKRW